jgi:transcriptional regulator with AAA-type ATPase domain
LTSPRLSSSAIPGAILLGPAYLIELELQHGALVLGRGMEADLVVDDRRVSRSHLSLEVCPDGSLRVEDRFSRNGTYLDGTRLVSGRPTPWLESSVCTFGSHALFRVGERGPRWVNHQRFAALTEQLEVLALRLVDASATDDQGDPLDGPTGEALHVRDVVTILTRLLPPDALASLDPFGRLVLAGSPGRVAGALQHSNDLRRLGLFLTPVSRPRPTAIGSSSSSSARRRLRSLSGFSFERIAESDVTVLVLGETGAGKEVLAREIHSSSRRRGGPFVVVDCGALSEAVFESELFGHERGAFTGAVGQRKGYIESAEGGTVFLDEIGELPPSLQAKLLRVLDERTVVRVGSVIPRRVNVRFVAATLRDLPGEVARGRFREDLYYRLSALTVRLPPLRERTDEIPEIVRTLLARADRSDVQLTDEALSRLRAHPWPGNVRELRSALDRALLRIEGTSVDAEHLDLQCPHDGAMPVTGSDDRRARVIAALATSVGNQTRAAELLGVSRRTLTNWLNELGIPRPRK